MSKGKVVLVGAGSGSWDLITLRGFHYLGRADVILYDSLIDKKLLEFARGDAIRIYVGKRAGDHRVSQCEINDMLVSYASRGFLVVRLKGGDPLTFGRGEEECVYVKSRGIECEVVPGVTSFGAASAKYLIPLGSRLASSSFAVTSPIRAGGRFVSEENIEKLIRSVDTTVFLMATSSLKRIINSTRKVYGERGNILPLMIISRLGMRGEKVILGDSGAHADVEPPSIVFVGGAVKWWLQLPRINA